MRFQLENIYLDFTKKNDEARGLNQKKLAGEFIYISAYGLKP